MLKWQIDDWKSIDGWDDVWCHRQSMSFLPFEEARKFVQHLHLKNVTEWREYCKSGKRPANIPQSPHRVYKEDWIGYGDWLGNGNVFNFCSFEAAKSFVVSLHLTSHMEWFKWCQTNERPKDIPTNPKKQYKEQWKGWGDYLGTNRVASLKIKEMYWRFEQAREFVISLGLKNQKEWMDYAKSGKKPVEIPYSPQESYKDKWISLGDWLGTGSIGNTERSFRDFKSARSYVRDLNIESSAKYKAYAKTGLLPKDIPTNPNRTYKVEWLGWGDWLGTFRIADQWRQYKTYDEARSFVIKLGIVRQKDWLAYWDSHKPDDLPRHFEQTYKQHWNGWKEFLRNA